MAKAKSKVATKPPPSASLTLPRPCDIVFVLILDYLMEYLDQDVHAARLRWQEGKGMVHFNVYDQKDLPPREVTRAGLIWSPDLASHPARVIRGISPRCASAANKHIWRHVWLIQEHHDLQRTIAHLESTHPDLPLMLKRYTVSFAIVSWPKEFYSRAPPQDRAKMHSIDHLHEWKTKMRLIDWDRSKETDGVTLPQWPIEAICSQGLLKQLAWLATQLKEAWCSQSLRENDHLARHLFLHCTLLPHFDTILNRRLTTIDPSVNVSFDLTPCDHSWTRVTTHLWEHVRGHLTILTKGEPSSYAVKTLFNGTNYEINASVLATNDVTFLGQCLSETTMVRADLEFIRDDHKGQKAQADRWLKCAGKLRSILKEHLAAHPELGKYTADEIFRCLDLRTGHKFARAVEELRAMADAKNNNWRYIGRSEAQAIADAFNATIIPIAGTSTAVRNASQPTVSPECSLKRKASGEEDKDGSNNGGK